MGQVESKEVLNELLVKMFNDILKIEEKALRAGEFADLTVTEMHIIEAIGIEKEKTMSEIASELDITVGTLTTAINRLIKKEYVNRRRIEEDRRVVLVMLTDNGKGAFESHATFHSDMIKGVLNELDTKEEVVLVQSLKKLVTFFEETYSIEK